MADRCKICGSAFSTQSKKRHRFGYMLRREGFCTKECKKQHKQKTNTR